MKILFQFALAFLIIVGYSISGCTKEEISGCTDPMSINYNAKATLDDGSCRYAPLCEVNKTGEVYFINHSNSNSTYDIIWDGVKIATIVPNQSSQVFTYPANVQHTLVFRFTNTSNNACTSSTPYLTQCQKLWFDCSY